MRRCRRVKKTKAGSLLQQETKVMKLKEAERNIILWFCNLKHKRKGFYCEHGQTLEEVAQRMQSIWSLSSWRYNFRRHRPEQSAPAGPALGRAPGLNSRHLPILWLSWELCSPVQDSSPAENQTHIPWNTCFPELYPPLLPLRRSFTRDRRALRAASTIASLVLPPAVQQNKWSNHQKANLRYGPNRPNYKLNPPSP